MPFPYAPDLVPARGQDEIGEPERDISRLRGQGLGRAFFPAAVQPLVAEVREDKAARHRVVRSAAVLVHPGPGVVRHREQVTAVAVRTLADDGDPAAFLWPRLLPPHPVALDDGERQADLLARHVGTGDRGGPFAIRCRFCSHSHTDIMPDSGLDITRHMTTRS